MGVASIVVHPIAHPGDSHLRCLRWSLCVPVKGTARVILCLQHFSFGLGRASTVDDVIVDAFSGAKVRRKGSFFVEIETPEDPFRHFLVAQATFRAHHCYVGVGPGQANAVSAHPSGLARRDTYHESVVRHVVHDDGACGYEGIPADGHAANNSGICPKRTDRQTMVLLQRSCGLADDHLQTPGMAKQNFFRVGGALIQVGAACRGCQAAADQFHRLPADAPSARWTPLPMSTSEPLAPHPVRLCELGDCRHDAVDHLRRHFRVDG